MNTIMETLGWWTCLAVVLILASFASKAFLRLVLDKGAAGEQVYFTETLIVLGVFLYKTFTGAKLSSACAFGVFVLVAVATDSSVFAAFGYASIAYVIGGIVTPGLMRRIRPLASPSTAPAVEEVKASPPDL